MDNSNISLLIESYVDKALFYCLKRCNNRMDAEDLSQTIILELIIAINKKLEIDNFDYYFFGICRNQYAKYVASKMKERDREIITDNVEVEDKKTTTLNDLVASEQIAMINRELKLLSRDYIEIVYRYYIDDMKLKTIAEELNLPLSTVKTRLYSIMRKLKESVKMEKIYGKKTYIPQNCNFVMSGTVGGWDDPWQYLRTLINKNLLFHSYNNPCTLEDYCLELGVSMPYIEDLVEMLTNITLLTKKNDKYITDFAFMDKEIQMKLYNIIFSYQEQFGKAVYDIAYNSLNEIRKIGFEGSDLSNEKLLWLIILYIEGNFKDKNISDKDYHTSRPNNGYWDFVGYESYNIKEEHNYDYYFIGLDGNSSLHCQQFCYNLKHSEIDKRKINPNELFNTIEYVYNLPRKYSEAKQNPKNGQQINELIENNLVYIDDDYIKFNFPFFTKREYEVFCEILDKKDYSIVNKLKEEIIQKITKEVNNYLPPYLKSQNKFVLGIWSSELRCICVNYGLDHNILTLAKDEKRFVYNLYMINRN